MITMSAKRSGSQKRQRNGMKAFRVNKEEDALIVGMAKYLGVSVANFCRNAALNEVRKYEKVIGEVYEQRLSNPEY